MAAITPRFIVRSLRAQYVSGDYGAQGDQIEVTLLWREKPGGGYANSYDSIEPSLPSGTIGSPSVTEAGITWPVTLGASSALFAVRIIGQQIDTLYKIRTMDLTYGVWLQVGQKPDVLIPAETVDPGGEVNVSSSLQTFLNGVANGSHVYTPEAAAYNCRYKIQLSSRWGLHLEDIFLIDDYGVTKDIDPARQGFKQLEFIRGGTHKLTNFRTNGHRPPGTTNYVEYQNKDTWHALTAQGVNGLHVVDPILENPWGDFLNPAFYINKYGELFNNWPCIDFIVEGSYTGRDEFDYPTGDGDVVKGGWMDNCGRMFFGITSAAGLILRNLNVGNGPRSGIDIEPGAPYDWNEDLLCEYLYFRDRLKNNVVANAGSGEWIHRVTIRKLMLAEKGIRFDMNGNVERRGLLIEDIKSLAELDSSANPIDVQGWDDVTVRRLVGLMDAGREKPAVVLRAPRGTWDLEKETIQVDGQRVATRVEEVTGRSLVKVGEGLNHYIYDLTGKTGTFTVGESLIFTTRPITGAIVTHDGADFVRFNAVKSQNPLIGDTVTGASSGATGTLAFRVHRDEPYNLCRIWEEDVIIFGAEGSCDYDDGEPDPPPPDIPTEPGEYVAVRRARMIRTAAGWVASSSRGSIIGV